uniref:Uncharacterized protein n=1 Tax=Euplotes harpa TaxID=151035 RepID=A0A7S3N523_9SPIT
MYREQRINQETKINLKYLVFLNDPNLLNILKRRHGTIEAIVEDIKSFSKNLTREVVEEELKNSDLFNGGNDIETEKFEEDDGQTAASLLEGQSSPMGSFLKERKKGKQKMDKSASEFYLDNAKPTVGVNGNTAVMSCGIGDSPKFMPASRRNR